MGRDLQLVTRPHWSALHAINSRLLLSFFPKRDAGAEGKRARVLSTTKDASRDQLPLRQTGGLKAGMF